METLEGPSAVSNKRKATGTEAQSLSSFPTGRAVAAREWRMQMEHPLTIRGVFYIALPAKCHTGTKHSYRIKYQNGRLGSKAGKRLFIKF